MAKPWKEFELLAARIEQLLAPEGAVVKSPDRIPDKITGSQREVDASIRYEVGSVDILITVECRKRGGVEDATWIEQLATKKKDIGASHTIAVSEQGFTKPAITKAETNGIELRQINQVTDEQILSWANQITFTREICFVRMKDFPNITVHADEPSEPIIGNKEIEKAYSEGGVYAKLFTYVPDPSKTLSLADIICATHGNNINSQEVEGETEINIDPGQSVSIAPNLLFEILARDIPNDGRTERKSLNYRFEKGLLRIPAEDSDYDVATLSFDVYLSVTTRNESGLNAVEYSSPEAALTHFADKKFTITQDGKEHSFRITRHKPADD